MLFGAQGSFISKVKFAGSATCSKIGTDLQCDGAILQEHNLCLVLVRCRSWELSKSGFHRPDVKSDELLITRGFSTASNIVIVQIARIITVWCCTR